jgi:hypothetical protein
MLSAGSSTPSNLAYYDEATGSETDSNPERLCADREPAKEAPRRWEPPEAIRHEQETCHT